MSPRAGRRPRGERPHPPPIAPDVLDRLLLATPAEREEFARTGRVPAQAPAVAAIHWDTTLCPVQGDGTLADGRAFYFHARGTIAALYVSPDGSDPLDQREPAAYTSHPAAGWLDEVERVEVLEQLAREALTRHPRQETRP